MDLVLAVVKDRGLRDLDVWAKSLACCGFVGRKVMFIENVPADAQEMLRSNGVEVVPFTTPDRWRHLHFQSYRYAVALDYLRFRTDLRFVIWTDVCDLCFQADPVPHLDEGFITAAREGRRINVGGGQGWNELWLRKFLPDNQVHTLLSEEILCSGTIAGSYKEMGSLIDAMWSYCSEYGEMRGIDQGIFNFLARQPFLKSHIRVPEFSKGFTATVGMHLAEHNLSEWTEMSPYFDRETGLVFTSPYGLKFSIVHQYDRTGGEMNPNGDWRGILERRYRGPS